MGEQSAAATKQKSTLKSAAAKAAGKATAAIVRLPTQPHAVKADGYTKKTIALVYDFDGTLSPKPMQEYSFLPQLGLDAADFWAECGRIAKEQRADPLITYMHLMYKKAKERGIRIDRADLVRQGASVELFEGVAA